MRKLGIVNRVSIARLSLNDCELQFLLELSINRITIIGFTVWPD